jgi:molybdate/tungstate transport system substrate-binding protein
MFPLGEVEQAFEQEHPSVDLQIEGHGSIQVIRQVTELGHKADLLMVADYSLIPVMMYTTMIPDTDESFSNWCIRFATNRMVLAYTNHSRYANEINTSNWCSILSRPDVRFGFPNPSVDALGYRALMTIQLAEGQPENQRAFKSLITDNFDPPINSIPEGENCVITVPEVQQPKSDKVTLRASSIHLIPLLETSNVDYCFLYLSNAQQCGFSFIEFPDEINLGNPEYDSLYEHVRVSFEHQRFSTINLDRYGKTINYGLTIPKNTLHPELSAGFVKFILEGKGRGIFESAYHPVFSPAFTDNLSGLPAILQPIVQEAD